VVQLRADGPLGELVLVRLRLEARAGFPNLDWHCSRVEVRRRADVRVSSPEDPETQVFLSDRWLRTAEGDVELRSGKCEKTNQKYLQTR